MPGLPYSPSKRGTIAEAALHTPYRKVAERFGCSISTVSRLVHQRQQTGSNQTAERPGRPPKHSPRTLGEIRRFIIRHRRDPVRSVLTMLRQDHLSISLSSLRRIMASFGYKRRVGRVKPFLNDRARLLRRNWAAYHRGESVHDWRRTIFVDEAAIRLNGTVKTWVTRVDGEAYLPQCLVPKMMSAKATCMVWGAIWYGGRSQLVRFDTSKSEGKKGGVTAAIYRDQITKRELKKVWERVNGRWRGWGGARIVEDGVSIHTSPINRSIGARQKFKYLSHPPNSSDLNPIENTWAHLKETLARLPQHPTTLDEIFVAAQKAWAEIPQRGIDSTVDSMPRRVQKVQRVNGFVTKY